MNREMGLYRGSSKYIKLELFDENNNRIVIDVSRLSLKLYRPNGSFILYTDGFYPQPDGTVIKSVSISDSEPVGIWRAVWEYIDEHGNKWVEEMPFVVSEART